MPNIMLFGFDQNPAGRPGGKTVQSCVRDAIMQMVVSDYPKQAEDAVITTVDSNVWSISRGGRLPFVRVTSTDQEDYKIARSINRRLGLDVEWQVIHTFLNGTETHRDGSQIAS